LRVCFREVGRQDNFIVQSFYDKWQVRCDWYSVFHGHDRGKTIPLHKTNHLPQVFELIEGWDIHVVKLVDWVDYVSGCLLV